ncbi:MAG: SufD family Fe-S cluster assembly protein [bacterium]|nr:MAG: SufD family Fe-S cluster assembly protein [bacterium]
MCPVRKEVRDGNVGERPAPEMEVDFAKYRTRARPHPRLKKLGDLPDDLKESTLDLGLDTERGCRAGSYVQVDHSVLFSRAWGKGLEVTSITDAAGKRGRLRGYRWRNLSPEADRFTEQAKRHPHHGFFIRVLPGVKVELPLQACLYMTERGLAQNVHNIIVAEEGSEIHIITGCGSDPGVGEGLHIGVTEYYIRKGATVSYTMIHSWGREMVVRPRSAALLEEEGVFISNFVSLKPVRSLQMDPVVTCVGKNARVRLNSILLAPEGTDLDVGGRIFLRAGECSAEIISRAITTGGRIVARGHVTGAVPQVKAHLECRGLILSEEGTVLAVPELEGLTRDVDLSHEAAVGRIAEEQITYLMSRGLTEETATSAIVRGFLNVKMEGLPSRLAAQISRAVEAADISGM